MKKILAISLALMMALALVACGNTENPSESGSSAASQSQPPESSEPTPEPRVIPDFPAYIPPEPGSVDVNAQRLIAESGTLEEQKALAMAENLSGGGLTSLMFDVALDDELAMLVAGRIKAWSEIDAKTQKAWAKHENPIFRQALAENPGVTQEALVILMTDSDAQVKASAIAAYDKLYGN